MDGTRWWRGDRPALAHLLAIAAPLAGLFLCWLVSPWLDTYTVLPALGGVIAAAWYGGLGPGLVATVVAVTGLDLLFVRPVTSLAVAATSDAIRLLFFALVATGASAASHSLRRARWRAERRAEEAAALAARLQESERRFRLLVQEVVDYAIFALDTDGRIMTWNAGAERLKGWTAAEILGRTLEVFYPPEDTAAGLPRRLLREAAERGRVEHEGWRVRKDGGRFWADVVITALRDEDGRLIGYSKVVRDLTERRAGEQALRAAYEEIAATTYAIAHDLRSPLRTIDGFAALLAREQGERLDARGRELLGRLRAGAQRLAGMLDALLALARLGRGELERRPVDLGALARTILGDLRRAEPERDVRVAVEDGLVAVGDPRLLGDLLQNLLANAWKFTRGRSPAVITVGALDEDGVRSFFVRDNGVGFDPTHAGQLFRPFHRLHGSAGFEGTGIGLATVRRIVERHGGRVWAEGRPGAGACFRFTLGSAEPEDHARDTDAADARGGRT